MTARNFLLRGLVAGLIAGFAAFCVAYTVGEPSVQRAIDLEESSSAPAVTTPHHATTASASPASPAAFVPSHDHGGSSDDDTVVSRHNQRTWGLLTGTLAVGTVLGGAVALIVAGVAGRLGRLSVRQSALLVSLIGFTALGLVPFLKYPANPPAVGSSETIGLRTATYFGFVLLSVVLAVLATYVGSRLAKTWGAFNGVTAAVGGYVALMVAAAVAFPSTDEVGNFPASTLWQFRLASLFTLASMWAAIGIGTAALLGRLADRHAAGVARRAFAASL